YVDRLTANAGIKLETSERASLIAGLETGTDDRASVLLKIVGMPVFTQKEKNRSLLLLHYFAYLQRNPGDPPDRDLSGFTFWLYDLERSNNPTKLTDAFKNSIEYNQRAKR